MWGRRPGWGETEQASPGVGLGQMLCWLGGGPNGGCWAERRVVLGPARGAEAAGGTPQSLQAHLTAPELAAGDGPGEQHSGDLPAA